MKTCMFCTSHIKDRVYRSLSSKSSIEQYKYAFEQLSVTPNEGCFSCYTCTNKLNKVCKLNYDIKTKVEHLREERDKVIGILRENLHSTPKLGKQRPALKTTTPKGKSKGVLFKTPEHHRAVQSSKEEKSTQTWCLTENYDLKITTKIAGKEVTKIIKEDSTKAALKSIFNRRTPRAILKNLCKQKHYRETMLEMCVNDLKKEVHHLVSKKCDILKNGEIEPMLDFNWSLVETNLKREAPSIFHVFSSLIDNKRGNLPGLITSLAVLLNARSRNMNQLQRILGLVVDKCGLSKEGMKILHNLGITVASSTIHKEKKNLIKKQEENISQTMSQYVESYYLQRNQRKHGIEVLGDNLDVTITPAKMTMSSQRKSLHWFLTIVKEKKNCS